MSEHTRSAWPWAPVLAPVQERTGKRVTSRAVRGVTGVERSLACVSCQLKSSCISFSVFFYFSTMLYNSSVSTRRSGSLLSRSGEQQPWQQR